MSQVGVGGVWDEAHVVHLPVPLLLIQRTGLVLVLGPVLSCCIAFEPVWFAGLYEEELGRCFVRVGPKHSVYG